MEKSDMMIQLIGSLSGIKTIPHICTTPTLIHTSFISRTPQFSTSGPTNNTLNSAVTVVEFVSGAVEIQLIFAFG